MNKIAVFIRRKISLTPTIITLELESSDGQPLPAYEAGAHIDIELPGGYTRQYSLCGTPQQADIYRVGILLDPQSRGGSISAHALIEGQTLNISPPKNLFPLANGKHSILFAGGIGITPILSMAYTLAKQSSSFEMHYCTRSRDQTAFIDELCSSQFDEQVHMHFDDECPLSAALVLANPQPDTYLYACGPTGFIKHITETAESLGWAKDNIRFELFSAPEAVGIQECGSFEIELSGSGQVITVAPDQTAAQAMIDAGINVPVSCEQGICGTCLMQVLDGTPDHRDFFLSDDEHAANNQFTPCCSRSHSARLVVDFT
ncbi:Vanillate O-demethylase oxidoreductase [Halopseudomonas bauzanensis]|nr:Vanillate O-demethylase oxidoreductase [Halopseudomonas bauzanensis]